MCNTTKELNKEIEFCENFKAEVVDGIFYPMLRFITNTKKVVGRSNYVLYDFTNEKVEKLLKSNKVLVLSNKTHELLYSIYGGDIEKITILNKSIGGIYVEYFQDKFWITNFKGFRIPLKLGKLLKAITNLNDKEISDVVDKHNRHITYDISLIQVTSDIVSIYDTEHSGSGSIGGSCMRGCGEFFESLQENAKDLQIAYLIDNISDVLIGRALLWVAYDSNGEPYKIMDRIYYDCERTKVLFEKYAEANGYYFRKETSGWCTTFYDTKNKQWVDLNLYVELSASLMGTYTPYMDTFRNYGGVLKLYNFGNLSYSLTSTDGDAINQTCGCCGAATNYECCYSDYHSISICAHCIEDYRYVEHLNDYIHIDNCIRIRDTDTYIHEDYLDECGVRYAEDGGYYDYIDYLYYAEDTGEYYTDSYNLYYAVDTQGFYECNLDLFYAEDTGDYYVYSSGLYEYDGVYYTELQEHLEEKEEEK